MFKRIDTEEVEIEGFEYLNQNGSLERVVIDGSLIVNFEYDYGETFECVFVEDIPNFIKALQATYDYLKEKQ